ncbi:MAG: hypothetical protein WCR54_04355 [Clostridia bacterium]
MPRKHSKNSLWLPETQEVSGNEIDNQYDYSIPLQNSSPMPNMNSRPNMPTTYNQPMGQQLSYQQQQSYQPMGQQSYQPMGQQSYQQQPSYQPMGQQSSYQQPSYQQPQVQVRVQQPRPQINVAVQPAQPQYVVTQPQYIFNQHPAPQMQPRQQQVRVRTQVVDNYDPRNVEYARTIVQPIAFVPYNTEEEPLVQYQSNNNGNNNYDEYDNYDNYSTESNTNNKKGFNALKLFTFLFSLIAIAILVAGKFFTFKNFLYIQGTLSGFEIIKGITAISMADIMNMLPTVLLTAGAAMLVLLTLISLLSMNRGTGAFSKTIAVLMTLFIIAFGIITFRDKSIAMGGYIVLGVCLLACLFTLIGKKRK